MVGQATIESLRRALAKEKGRQATEQEVQEALDYLYALAGLIYEAWAEQKVENKQINQTNYDDDTERI